MTDLPIVAPPPVSSNYFDFFAQNLLKCIQLVQIIFTINYCLRFFYWKLEYVFGLIKVSLLILKYKIFLD